MHRSGTSVLGGVLERLGVCLPGEQIAADQHNPSGYFEWSSVVDLQERLLIDLDRWWPSYSGTKPLPKNWLESPATLEAKSRLSDLLRSESHRQQGLWAIKDPRSSLLLPLWFELAQELNLPLRLLLAVRDPAEVVGSLVTRDGPVTGMNSGRAQRLWARHNLEVIEACAHTQSLKVVDYGAWFACPEQQLKSLVDALPELEPSSSQMNEALAFIQPGYRHAVNPAIRSSIAPVLVKMHRRIARGSLSRMRSSSSVLASLPADSSPVPSVQQLLANPTFWSQLLESLRHYPAPRHFPVDVGSEQTLIFSSCGSRWTHWGAHFWLQRLPLSGLSKRPINLEMSGLYQLQLDAETSLEKKNQSDQFFRVTLNFECPEPGRVEHWLQHLQSQQLIWDPDPARVLLLRALGLPAWWLDPDQPANGWLERPEASSVFNWLEHLGMAPPLEDHLQVLGWLGPTWDQALVAEAELGEEFQELQISYAPGWSELVSETPLCGLAWAGWLAAASRLTARLVWAHPFESALDESLVALDPVLNPSMAVTAPMDPAELRALHLGSPLMAKVEDRPTPGLKTRFAWERGHLQPLASVVVSSHDYGTRIVTALESVRQQTLSPLELIVVDDASSDNSVSVIHSWMDQVKQDEDEKETPLFSRLLLLEHEENAGLATARNTAFEAARAEWCFVLDADNRLLPEALRVCLEVAERLRFCPRLAVVHPLIAMEIETARADEQRSLLGGPSWQRGRFLEGNIVDAMALVRRSVWQAVGGYSHLEGGWEDYDFWCKLVADGWQGVQCPQVLALYRSHTEAMTYKDTAHRQRALSRTLQERHPWLRLPLGT